MHTRMHILWQIGILFGVCLAGEGISLILPVPFPASVISMVLLFVLLLARWIKPACIEDAAHFLQGNMGFFFVPINVGIMQIFSSLRDSLAAIFFICILTTVLTFAAASSTVRGVMALQARLRVRREGRHE